MLVGSYSGSGGKYLIGAVHFDGACGITGANTFGGVGGNFAQASVTGTYGLNSDGTFGVTLNLSGQSTPQTYIVGVSQSGNEAVGIETDGTSAYIDLQSQLTTLTSGFNTASLNGTYAASCVGAGVDLNYQTFDGQGNITGVDSEYNVGVVTTNTPYTGTYTVNSDGTYQGSVLFGGSTVPFYGVLDNGNNEIEFIYTGVNSCSGKKSTTTSLSGTYGILAYGPATAGGGEQFLTGAINLSGGLLSGEVNGGLNAQYGNSAVNGSYTVNSNNTVTITMNLAGQSTPETFNVGVSEAGNEADGIETDDLAEATVDLQNQLFQSSQPYSTASLNGTYAVVCSNIGIVALNYVTFDGLGDITSSALAYSDGGNYGGDNPYTGSYAVNSDGTFSGSLVGSFAGYTFTGVIDNDTSEIAYTYEVGGSGNQACSGVSTYGPVGSATVAPTPTFSPAPGNIGSGQSVTLSDTLSTAVIHYTTNGTPPTANSPVYSAAIPVSTVTSIQAIAVAPGDNNSAIGSGTYYPTTLPTAATPTFSPLPGNYSSTQTVTLSDTTPGAVIHCTTNGTMPTATSPVCTTVSVSSTTTIEAIAVATGYNNSLVAIGIYTITLTAATPTFSPAPGNYTSTQTVTLSDTTPGAVIHCTTNGTTPTATSPVCTTVTVSATTTIEALAVAAGYNNSAVFVGLYTITSGGSATQVNLSGYYNIYGIGTVGNPPPNGGVDGAGKAYNSSTLGTTATYQGLTFNFAAPNTLDALISQTVALPAGSYSQLFLLGLGAFGAQNNQTFIVTYTDKSTSTFTQSMSDWWHASNFPGETIVASPANIIASNGTLLTQNVNLYGYTFNLTAGKTAATLTLPSNRDAIFLAIGLGGTTAATPTFSPAPGNYTSTQTVTLSDSTPGAVIHCTTNGTTPTATSPVCTTVSVSSTTTIEALAVATGYNNSAVATGVYTIGSGTVVSLSSYFNVYGIVTSGTAPANGGFDNDGYAYNSSLLGTSLSYQGLVFTLGAANVPDAVDSQTIPVTPGQYSELFLLGAAVNGSQANQTIVVTYTDNSTSTFTQSFSDWAHPQGYSGEAVVAATASRIGPGGIVNNTAVNAYGYTFALTAGKSVSSVKLPSNRNVVFLGMGLGGAANSTPIIPYIQVNNGAWQQISSTSVSTGSSVNLGPQPLTGGSWSWTGPNGYTSTSRQINNIPLSTGLNVYVATYTNSSGVKSTETFTITVTGTPIVPYIQVNNGSWQQTATTTVTYGSSVNLGPQPLNGGSWSWTGPYGYNSTSRQINNIPLSFGTNTYVATYTDSTGAKSTETFTITVTNGFAILFPAGGA